MYFDNFLGITENDIIDLIDNKTTEQKTLEYKCQLPDKSKEEEKTKTLKCISSFANTDGGVIIFGMKENEKGEASEIINIETPTDEDFLRIQNMIKDRILPRMTPPDLRELKVDGKKIYLMNISPSFVKPHYVKSNWVFYGRNSSGKYELDVSDIRNLFLKSKNTEEQFENFRIQRIMKLKSSNFPFKYNSQKIISLHIASLSSLNNDIQLSMSKNKYNFQIFVTMSDFGNSIINYDGCLNYCYTRDNKMESYVQIFRNGFIESTYFGFLRRENENKIDGSYVEGKIKNAITNHITGLKSLNISFPLFISISFLNTKGHEIVVNRNNNRNIHPDFEEIFDEDLLLPSMFIDNNDELDEKLNICFDVFWNANGYSKNPTREN